MISRSYNPFKNMSAGSNPKSRPSTRDGKPLLTGQRKSKVPVKLAPLPSERKEPEKT